MKKITLIPTLVAVVFTISSCSNPKDKVINYVRPDTVKIAPHSTNVRGVRGNYAHVILNNKNIRREVLVGDVNFNKMVTFIEKHGFVTSKDVPSDHQYTFFDTQGNRHAFVVMRRDKNNDPSVKGDPDIAVWGYYKGVKDLDHFFGYNINKEKAFLYLADDNYILRHMHAVEKGYDDFLAMINK